MRSAAVRFSTRITGFLCALVVVSDTANAQISCSRHWQSTGLPNSDLDRSLQLAKLAPVEPTGVIRSGWSMVQSCASLADQTFSSRHFEWSLLPAQVVAQGNSAYPRAQQDGLRWSGRGLSAAVSAGAAVRWGPITGALVPMISYQQNDAFTTLPVPTPELSPYSNYFHTGVIDRPQRFGSSSFFWAHPGQSFLRLDAYGAAAGFSTENLRWGPARQNPILMSGAAAGFPHFFIGTAKPVDARVALLGVEMIWGRLTESSYFDNLETNNTRLLAGIVATITPKQSGMTLGIARAFVRTQPPEGVSLSEEIFGPYTGVRDNPDVAQGDNQLVSLFLSWTLPEAGFEAYGEYAREDHWEDAMDVLMQPDHSRGYTIGFEKVFSLRGTQNMLRVAGEATNLGHAPTWQSRGGGGATFYTHSQVRQGYTHRGQLLGAPIGPGSDAQYITADYFTPTLLGGLYYARVRYDNDTYYRNFGVRYTNHGHDVEWTVGTRGAVAWRDFQFVADLGYSTRHNREFVQLLNTGELTQDKNVSITFGAAWLPRARRNDD